MLRKTALKQVLHVYFSGLNIFYCIYMYILIYNGFEHKF